MTGEGVRLSSEGRSASHTNERLWRRSEESPARDAPSDDSMNSHPSVAFFNTAALLQLHSTAGNTAVQPLLKPVKASVLDSAIRSQTVRRQVAPHTDELPPDLKRPSLVEDRKPDPTDPYQQPPLAGQGRVSDD